MTKLEMYDSCIEDPTKVFDLIKKGYYDVVKVLINENKVNVNTCDSIGNDVCMRLLKAKQYDLLLPLMKKKNWNVNHKNEEGNTFGHILASDLDFRSVKIFEQLFKKSNYEPNITNHNGETSFDKAINSKSLINAIKIFEDKRFNHIDIKTFNKFYNAFIKSNELGSLSKKSNLNIMIKSLKKKDLDNSMEIFLNRINDNKDIIIDELSNNKSYCIDNIYNKFLVQTI